MALNSGAHIFGMERNALLIRTLGCRWRCIVSNILDIPIENSRDLLGQATWLASSVENMFSRYAHSLKERVHFESLLN